MLDTVKVKTEVNDLCKDVSKWSSRTEFDGLNKNEFTELMKIKYNYLYTNSSTLFERCIKGDLNIQQLTYMLNMIDKINSGADYQQTSTEVGQNLVDVYVKPLIDDKKK